MYVRSNGGMRSETNIWPRGIRRTGTATCAVAAEPCRAQAGDVHDQSSGNHFAGEANAGGAAALDDDRLDLSARADFGAEPARAFGHGAHHRHRVTWLSIGQ